MVMARNSFKLAHKYFATIYERIPKISIQATSSTCSILSKSNILLMSPNITTIPSKFEYSCFTKTHNQFSARTFCSSVGNRQNNNVRELPKIVYMQNPLTWLINKLDFRALRNSWDPDFNEEEFKRGSKQAAAIICYHVSENLWENLIGLLTRPALSILRREVETKWDDENRRNVTLAPSDIKLVLPRRINFQEIGDRKYVDIDVVLVGMKFKEEEPTRSRDVLFVEMMARFHRNYSFGELPNWTISLFKITRFDIVKRERVPKVD